MLVGAVVWAAVEVAVPAGDVDVGADTGPVVLMPAAGAAAEVPASVLEPVLSRLDGVTRTTTVHRPHIRTTATPAMIATRAAVGSFFSGGMCVGSGCVGGYVKISPRSGGPQQDTGWFAGGRHPPKRHRR